MNFKKILFLFLALAVVASLASCKEKDGQNNECVHVDANDDYLCDNCGDNFDDGDETPDVVAPTAYQITFEVKLDSGEALAGVRFTLTRGSRTYELTSDANGLAKQSLEAGPYAIEYNYDSLPEYCTPDVFGFKVEESANTVTLLIVNNTPDGTNEKPFPIHDNVTEVNIDPGQSIYYVYRGATVKDLTINHEGISVSYNGQVYTAVDGVVSLQFVPEIGKQIVFSVNNITDNSISTNMNIIALPGSNENPIELSESSAVVSVNEESIVYYKWIADKNGVLVLSSTSEFNNISLIKTLENDVLVISQTDGDAAAYLVINEGDEIVIGVSAINSAENVDIDFSINSYAGTDAEPVPVLSKEINISLGIGESIVFTGEVGKTVHIKDDSLVSVWHDTITYTNEEGNEIVVPLFKTTFVVNNNGDHVNGITITIK